MILSEIKIAWLQPILGQNGNLMYMGPLLHGLADKCLELHVFAARYDGAEVQGNFKITCSNSLMAVERRNAGLYPAGIRLIGPSIARSMIRYKPDLLILNEFSLLTLYGVIISLLRPSTRVLLLVECKPYSLGGFVLSTLKLIYRRFLSKFADMVLTNNQLGGDYLLNELNIPLNKIITRPYLVSDMTMSVPPEAIDRIQHRTLRDDGNIRFLYVGQLIERKGLQFAFESIAKLVSLGYTCLFLILSVTAHTGSRWKI